jgi:hypothetical protein
MYYNSFMTINTVAYFNNIISYHMSITQNIKDIWSPITKHTSKFSCTNILKQSENLQRNCQYRYGSH